MKRWFGVLCALALVVAAGRPASAGPVYQFGSVYSLPLGPTSLIFDITPFDSSLGTLNSVTFTAEVNVSGSAQLWSSDELATLTFNFSNTLDALPEMGWGPTVASFSGSEALWYYDYDFLEGYVQADGSGNSYAFNTIYNNFGRFEGAGPFQLGLQLSGSIGSSGSPGSDSLAWSYDGNATLTYEYDYTPVEAVPDPGSTLLLLGMGVAGLAAAKRRWR